LLLALIKTIAKPQRRIEMHDHQPQLRCIYYPNEQILRIFSHSPTTTLKGYHPLISGRNLSLSVDPLVFAP